MKHRHRSKERAAPVGSTRAKGDVLEQIVAEMHETPGVNVKCNVFLPVLDGSSRTREVDVLLTSQVAGYPVSVAIECKNEKKPTGVAKIDEFIGKLQDVGIPTQLGIFVSSSRYTSGAISRARQAGIKTLLFQDRTEKLVDIVQEALQSLIYLLLTITSIRIGNDVPGNATAGDILFFRDKGGAVCGSVPDLVWKKWVRGEIPQRIGNLTLIVELPENWFQIVDGRVAQVYSIEVDIQVNGYVITFPGKVRHLALVEASEKSVEKTQLNASFNLPAGTFPTVTFQSETDLQEFIEKARGINIFVGRFPLPRIIWNSIYWPPSESTIYKLRDLFVSALEKGENPDFTSLSIGDIEGTDLGKIWEPIWREHPANKDDLIT